VTAEVEQAYVEVERLTRARARNFAYGIMVLPKPKRRAIAAIYAFARAADDFADEGHLTIDERHRLLDGWLCRLREAASTDQSGRAPQRGEPAHSEAIFVALGATIRARSLPVQLFEDLLSAFRQDVTVSSYASWRDVFDYCRRSANPVGRLVLRVAGYDDPKLDAWSDSICTALQLANFWQDAKRDYDRGRVYMPEEELRASGASRDGLHGDRVDVEWTRALASAVTRTRALFDAGRPLCDAVSGRLKYELRATWLGGMRVLERLESSRFDIVRNRPTLGAADAPWLAWRLAMWPLTRG
jgi:squalene synthase HpnC